MSIVLAGTRAHLYLKQIQDAKTLGVFVQRLQSLVHLSEISKWEGKLEPLLSSLKLASILFVKEHLVSRPDTRRSFALSLFGVDIIPDALLIHVIGFVGDMKDVSLTQRVSKRFSSLFM